MTVEREMVGRIGVGLLVLVGVAREDAEAEVVVLVDKLLGLRIFPDDAGRMNRSVVDVDGGVLVVSQFTLLGDVRRGRRPSFTAAAHPDHAEPLVAMIAEQIARRDVEVATGMFGAMMDVELLNSGPVTLVIDVTGGSVQ